MLEIRPAETGDVDALCAVRYDATPAVHRDRIAMADSAAAVYLVVLHWGTIVGFGLLVLQRPDDWHGGADRFPLAVDLYVTAEQRGRGLGSLLLERMEQVTKERGFDSLHLTVDAEAGPGPLRLYERRGYRALNETPILNEWRFVDSDGVEHVGTEWAIAMQKKL